MKRILSFALLLVMLFSLAACDEPGESDGTTVSADNTALPNDSTTAAVEDDKPVNGNLILMKDNESLFKVIRADRTTPAQTSAAVAVNKAITELTKKSLGIETDYRPKGQEENPDALEILVGDTNRPESAALKAELGDSRRFAIKTTDTKVIIVASNDTLLGIAVEYFIENGLKSSENEVSEGNLVLKVKFDYKSDEISALYDTLTSAKLFDSTCSKEFTIARPSDVIKTVQGGCSDGTYYYQAFLQKVTATDEKTNVVRIVKIDMATGKRVLMSGDLDLNHSNDITYNPKTNQLIVCHNNPYRTKISIIDPETLEFIESKTIPCSIYSIDYNAQRDIYVVGLSGGQTFRFLTSDFKFADNEIHTPTPDTKGYTTQGVACDNNLIYFVLYKSNVITVYDWDGNFVSLITLDVGSVEPENITIVNDEIYVGSTGSGATVWKVIPKAIQSN